MSSRDTLTMTRVSSLRSSPNRSNLLSSVSETCEDEWDPRSGNAVNPNLEQVLTESLNIVQSGSVVKDECIISMEEKYSGNQTQENIEISEPSIKCFLAKECEYSVQISSEKTNRITNIATDSGNENLDIENNSFKEDKKTSESKDLTEMQQIRKKISSEILSIDPLTRKKISSLQHCHSFDHADSEDESAVSSKAKRDLVSSSGGLSNLNVPSEPEDEGSSQDEEDNLFLVSRSRVSRNPSYQRAVTKAGKINRFSIDVAVSDEVSNEAICSSEKLKCSKAPLEPQCTIRDESSHFPPTTTDTSASVVSRSVSFNDRLLESTRVDSSLSSRSSSFASRKEDSPPSSSSKMLRQMSTPADAKPIVSLSTYQSLDLDMAASGASSDANSQQRRMSLKNITSNFSKKFTSKSSKKTDKKEDVNKITYPQMVNGVPPSETSAAVVSYEGLLRLFECPGCQTMMLPPFLQCKKGHLLCEKCKVTFKGTCPLCKQRVSDSTNYMMEQVCQLVRFPCKFGQFGCSEFYPPRQKAEHEHFCHHRPVHCHFESNGCTKILPLKDMKQHLNECQWKSSDQSSYQ